MTVFVVGSANRKVDLSVVSSKGNFHFALANIDLIVVQKASKNGKDAKKITPMRSKVLSWGTSSKFRKRRVNLGRSWQTDNAMWKKTQLRVDPADGNAYSLDSFLECYGEDEGQRRWGSAGQQPAGVSLLHDLMAFLCVFQRILFLLAACRCFTILLPETPAACRCFTIALFNGFCVSFNVSFYPPVLLR